MNAQPSNHLRDLALLCSNELLELHVLPTEQCNFRCTYCYEDFEQGQMQPRTIEAIKRLLDARADGLRVLSINWFGGEPLVAMPVIEQISGHAKQLAERGGLRFHGGATTNAWHLGLPTLTRLVEVGVTRFQVTLDGPADVHDRVRLRADGKGTFARIWSNLVAAKHSDLGFEIMVRLHIRPDTIDRVERWLPELRESLLCDPRFSVLVKPVEHLGGPKDGLIQIFTGDEDRHVNVSRIYRLLGGASGFRDDILGRTCYAARPNAWVIRANGDLNKCTVDLSGHRNRIGRLLDDGRMELEHAKLTPWFDGLETMDPEVLACPAAHLRTPEA